MHRFKVKEDQNKVRKKNILTAAGAFIAILAASMFPLCAQAYEYTFYEYDAEAAYSYLYGTMELEELPTVVSVMDTELEYSSVELYAPEILQYPELPTGCEATSLTIALNSCGFDVDKETIADAYLPYGVNYIWAYSGDPATENGAGIFPPGLTNAANSYLTVQDSSLYAVDLTGTEFTDLYKFIQAGYPVIVWTTTYMEYPMMSGEAFWANNMPYEWYHNEHCVVMYGYDLESGTVQISDPLEGLVERDAAEFESIYSYVGAYAIVIL